MIPKFRVFEKERKIMCKVEELVFSWDDGNLQKISYYWEDYGEYLSTSKLGDVVLMQSTGLKDKNGVEIYEGDVVNITQYFGGHPYGETKHIIKRSEYNNNLVADRESGNRRMPEVSMSFRKSDDYEVIGNIYENLDLLKENTNEENN